VACSAGPLSTSGNVQGELALDDNTNDNNCNNGSCCFNETLSGAAVAGGSVFVVHDFPTTLMSSGCGSTGLRVERIDFSDAGAQTVTDYTGNNNNDTATTELAIANDVLALMVSQQQGQKNLAIDELTLSGSDAGSVSLSQPNGLGANLFGLVIGPTDAYFGAWQAPQNQCIQNGPCPQTNPDESSWSSASGPGDGGLVHVNLIDGGMSSLGGTSFDGTYSQRLLVADGTNVYWVAGPDPGTLMQTAKATFPSAPTAIATIQSAKAVSGLAVSQSGPPIVYSVMGDIFNGGTGCTIFALAPPGTPTMIYSSPSTSCMGVALDGNDVYFAIVHGMPYEQCCSQDGGSQGTATYIAGTAIGRISLSGPSSQTASTVSVASDRYYGPRRVLVDPNDATFIYAIDPSYVLRVAKSAFP